MGRPRHHTALQFRGPLVTGSACGEPPCDGKMKQKGVDENQPDEISRFITV